MVGRQGPPEEDVDYASARSPIGAVCASRAVVWLRGLVHPDSAGSENTWGGRLQASPCNDDMWATGWRGAGKVNAMRRSTTRAGTILVRGGGRLVLEKVLEVKHTIAALRVAGRTSPVDPKAGSGQRDLLTYAARTLREGDWQRTRDLMKKRRQRASRSICVRTREEESPWQHRQGWAR